jgi:hypothetical protein
MENGMTRKKQLSILVLAALILSLGSSTQTSVFAARQVETPSTTPRFVVFEAFLSAG